MVRPEVILTICAHNDDQIIGAGGTLVKYAREGKTVRTIICSFGASSHPHLQRKVIVRQRVGESVKADRIMGGKGIAYLGLEEGHFHREFVQKNVADKLAAIIQRERPAKIFTHASDDVHTDHRAVNYIVQSLIDRGAIKCPAFEFPVWHLAKLTRRGAPQLIVDISKTFATKLKAFEAHESQQVTIWNLFWNVYLRARFLGLLYRCKYAELFYLMEAKQLSSRKVGVVR